MKACTLIRDYTSSCTLVLTGLILLLSSDSGNTSGVGITFPSIPSIHHESVTPIVDAINSVSMLTNMTSNQVNSTVNQPSSAVHNSHEDEMHEWHHKLFHSASETVVNYTLSIVDASFALICCIILAVTFYPSAKEYSLILLQSLPKNIDVKQLKKQFMDEFSHSVLSIHDLHIWSHTPLEIIATCHVSLSIKSKSSYIKLINEMKNFFAKNGVTSSTIQPEFRPTDADDDEVTSRSNSSSNNSYACLYRCSDHAKCKERLCCKNDDIEEDDKTCHAHAATAADEERILMHTP